jgi:hypothetical protein
MAFRVLSIEFTLRMTTQQYKELGETVAADIARVPPGLLRKTWIWNQEQQEAGGLYLFEDQQSLERYLNGPIVAQLREMKQVDNLRARQFDVLEEATMITRGIERSTTGARTG